MPKEYKLAGQAPQKRAQQSNADHLSPAASSQVLTTQTTEPLWSWPELIRSRKSLMAVLNVTPDSFYDGGQHQMIENACQQALNWVEQGALYIDIGGESSRPGAEPVSTQEELDRVLPVINELISINPELVISIDTVKPKVADACLKAGAKIVNDIRGLRDPKMRAVVAEHQAGAVIMHMRGVPKTMQKGDLSSKDITTETYNWLKQRLDDCLIDGIPLQHIALDIGIGFGKTLAQNLKLIKDLDRFSSLACPLLVGASRKSFIGAIDGSSAVDRLPGSLSAIVEASRRGGNIFRVHDVAESKQALWVAESIVLGDHALPPLNLTDYLYQGS
ncbi:MAG: dihydropteroate synthase [Myxococcales bacterium]|nr:dihydropteroate synthase [Myxococcales bacterium]